jgi:uncharacterized protein YjdB
MCIGGFAMKKKRLKGCLAVCLILVVTIVYTMDRNAVASGDTPQGNYFMIGTEQLGTEYDMTGKQTVNISLANTPTGTVKWKTSANTVVDFSNNTGSATVTLNRKGPGSAYISAAFDGHTIGCNIKIRPVFDMSGKMTTAGKSGDSYFVIDENTSDKRIHIQDETTANVIWTSDNESIVKVDSNTGELTPVGGGTAIVTVSTLTNANGVDPLKNQMYVAIKPKFTLNYDSAPKESAYNSYTEVNNVPSAFTIGSNAENSDDLSWKIIDKSTNKELSLTDTSKMTCKFSTISGNVEFTNVKAGVYQIYAYANKDIRDTGSNIYAAMQITVPIVLDNSIVMGVTDTYSLLENSNIPSAGIIIYPNDIIKMGSIVRADKEQAVLIADKVGKKTITIGFDGNVYTVSGAAIVKQADIAITVIDGISISATKATLYEKGTLLLEATYTDANSVTWRSSNENVAKVSMDGLVTAVKKGTATITAEIKDSKGVKKTASCEITVKKPITSITLKENDITFSIGSQQTIVATIEPSDADDKIKLKWESSNENVVIVSKAYDSSAVIEAVGSGRAVISAIDKNNVVVGYCHVVVKKPVNKIVLNETDVTLNSSTSQFQLNATVYPEDATDKKVTWRSSNSSIASVNKTSGMVTINRSGKVTIIATSVDNPAVSELCNITIEMPVTSVLLDQIKKTMYAGESTRLTYVVSPSNSTDNSVTWTSSNSSVVTVDSTGKVYAVRSGVATIIIRTSDGGYTDYCDITVKQVAAGVKLDATKITIAAGAVYYFKPTLLPSDSTDTVLTWQSSNTSVAKIDSDGKLTGIACGISVITVKTDTGATASCIVTVIQKANGLTLNYTEKTIYIGDKFDLKATISPSNATNSNVTWKSSNTKAVTISAKGEVKGVAGGVSVITCTTTDGGYFATCMITVKELTTSVKLNYSSYRLGVNHKLQLKATVKSKTATNKNVTWSTSNWSVATIDQKGKVTAQSKGYTTITAKARDGSGAEASCRIRVITPVTKIKLAKGYMSMLVGQSKAVKAAIKPSNATYKTAKWTSSDTNVALVDEDGTITALKAGSTVITAAARDNSGKKALCYVTVRERVPATGIIVMDKTLSMVPGEEKTVQVSLNPADSTDGYTWSSDNTAVAKVNKKTGRITAAATGTANIIVMTDSGKTAMTEVTVVGLNMTSITLEQYTTYPYNLIVEGTISKVTWSIKNPRIGVLTQTGRNTTRVSSRGVGKTTITAIVNGRKLTCTLNVTKIK